MISYEDRRLRYLGHGPADFPPGVPRHDNPVKLNPARTELARSYHVRPFEAFRDTTAPKPIAPPAPEPTQPVEEPIKDDWYEL